MPDEMVLILLGVGMLLGLVAIVVSVIAGRRIDQLYRTAAEIRMSIQRLFARCDKTDRRTDRIDRSINDIYEDLTDHNLRLRYLESAGNEKEES